MTIKRTYSELVLLSTFEERFNYLRLDGEIGKITFGFDRFINQNFYKSKRWLRVRDQVIQRDNGNDLGIVERPIFKNVHVHHMNPVSIEDLVEDNLDIFNPNFLISVSLETHLALHFSKHYTPPVDALIVRKPGDTKLW